MLAFCSDTDRGEKVVEMDPTSPRGGGTTIFNGLTLAIGIHSGQPTSFCYNKVTSRMDYFGQVVNRCARVMSTSAIGEISISNASIALLRDEDKIGFELISRGEHELKGVKEPMEITTIIPQALKGRLPVFEEMRDAGEVFSPSSPRISSPGVLSPTGD